MKCMSMLMFSHIFCRVDGGHGWGKWRPLDFSISRDPPDALKSHLDLVLLPLQGFLVKVLNPKWSIKSKMTVSDPHLLSLTSDPTSIL